ncbi:hypothetical protein B0H11DRAFT_1075167 [Mycena galericulata]|nr:hypothetical protein B0H11DRAFT_1075167 [Mycena galericulata]
MCAGVDRERHENGPKGCNGNVSVGTRSLHHPAPRLYRSYERAPRSALHRVGAREDGGGVGDSATRAATGRDTRARDMAIPPILPSPHTAPPIRSPLASPSAAPPSRLPQSSHSHPQPPRALLPPLPRAVCPRNRHPHAENGCPARVSLDAGGGEGGRRWAWAQWERVREVGCSVEAARRMRTCVRAATQGKTEAGRGDTTMQACGLRGSGLLARGCSV